jgi:hypothetical protein
MKRLKRLWYGKPRPKIMSYVNESSVGEIAYYGRFNKIIGYWCYGYYDPALPYKGDF